MERIRAPILTVLGHVDAGKTTLLDKIRGTAIAKTEAGQITQAIGATNFPVDVIKNVCGNMLNKMKIELKIPGLLIIDTPGHEAFTTLRKRGGAIADLAILVVDINEGFKPQTEESLNYLKQYKTPFVVAVTKIDRLLGWRPKPDSPFAETFNEQSERAQAELEEKLYRIIGQLGMKGFQAERIDRIADFAKQVAVVPLSGITGEGLPDLLVVLCGLSQKYLEKGLRVSAGEGKGTILEVKEVKGFGITIDVILYDGEIRRGDWLVIGGKEIVKTKAKALLQPEPLRELRIEKIFRQLEHVHAAAGIKIAASELEDVIAGSPLRAVRSEKEIDKAVQEVKQEIEEVEIESDKEGVILKADTLGGLEALIKSFRDMGIPIRKAQVGNVAKSDVMDMRVFRNPLIFVFNIRIPEEMKKLAEDNKVKVFQSDVIYRLIEDYQKWVGDKKKRTEEEILQKVTRPGTVKVLTGYVFRQKNPAVFGVEVLKGIVKPGYRLKKGDKIIGEIKEIQSKGKNLQEAKAGEKVALSMQDVTFGKDIKEGDLLENFLSEKDLEKLEKIRHKLNPDEKELLASLE